MVNMIVSIQPPFCILAAEDGVEDVFDYHTKEIMGLSIFHLTGPNSDRNLLRSSILGILATELTAIQLVLYRRNGQDNKYMSSFQRHFHETGSICCQIHLKVSSGVTLQEAFEERILPHALVSSMYPHIINVMNEGFKTKFGRTSKQTLGQPLCRVIPPSIDLEIMIQRTGCFGDSITQQISAFDLEQQVSETVSCIPVTDVPNGPVRYILVVFANVCKISPYTYQDEPQAHAQAYNHVRSITPPTFCRAASFASVLQSCHASPPAVSRSASDGQVGIRPRTPAAEFRPAQSHASSALTTEALRSLRGLPLPQAARAVGVSATAFKRACRRLGVQRWDYTRGPGRRTSRGPNDSSRRRLEYAGVAAAIGPPGSAPPALARCLGTTPMDSDEPARGRSPPETHGIDGWLGDGAAEARKGAGAGGAGPRRGSLDLAAWLATAGEEHEPGGPGGGPEGPDALVLEMLAQPWQLNT